MRKAALVLVCLLVLLAGCNALTGGGATTTAVDDGTTVETTTTTATTTTAAETTAETTTADATTVADAAQGATTNESNETGGDATPESGDTADATSDPGDTATETDTTAVGADTTGTNVSGVDDIADPASDRLGWEGGYWYNESLSISTEDGLNASERAATVNRTMARIEQIRRLEFTESVPVSVLSRAEYQQQRGGAGGEASAALRAFDNAKFEALFMIGEEENSLATQESNLNQSVAGFYSQNGSIVVVSDSETPQLTRSTLSHELTHALQDQHFDLFSGETPVTRDGLNARNGVVEGEANYIQRRYETRCVGGDSPAGGGVEWTCRETPSAGGDGGGSASDIQFGVYLLQYFPYAAGPGFINDIYQEQGWEGVNQLHEALPESAEQVIYPDRYGTDPPTNLTIPNASAEGWTRVRPEGRVNYATLGQSALSAMFGYTAYDQYNRTSIVSQQQLLNVGFGGGVNTSDPINYDLNVTEGWDGDRMHVYQNDAGETGYVWKLAWDSPAEAEEFAAGYEALLSHWGGKPTESGTWTLAEDSPFADAISIQRNGDTVTITNAPTTEGLDALQPKSS